MAGTMSTPSTAVSTSTTVATQLAGRATPIPPPVGGATAAWCVCHRRHYIRFSCALTRRPARCVCSTSANWSEHISTLPIVPCPSTHTGSKV